MKNRLCFIGGLFFFLLALATCAPVQPEKPPDPAYLWASGNWVGETGRGRPADAYIKVINGNQLTGSFTYHSTSGSVSEGVIESGMVGKKNDVDFIEGKLIWSFGSTTTFRMGREDDHIIGNLSHGDELPWSVRFVILKKAK